MMWEIGITPNYKALNIVYYNNNQIVSIDNFVSSLDLRNQVIAEKKHMVNNGVNNPTTGDRLTPDNNPNSGRRYPESSICPNCKGTKVESFPMYENDPSGAAVNAGRQIGYTNSRGHLCKYCGKYTWHIHLKCYKCN